MQSVEVNNYFRIWFSQSTNSTNSPTDYRLTFETDEALKATTYLEPCDHENNKKLDRIFKSLSKQEEGYFAKLNQFNFNLKGNQWC